MLDQSPGIRHLVSDQCRAPGCTVKLDLNQAPLLVLMILAVSAVVAAIAGEGR